MRSGSCYKGNIMFGCLFGHNLKPNFKTISKDLNNCMVTCTKCGHSKIIDFAEYSRDYAQLTTLEIWGGPFDTKALEKRDMVKTIMDPWGGLKFRKILDDMNAWKDAGYPGD